jgi:hypothetical protein
MPTYRVTDPQSGLTVDLTGDSPPTEQELTQIFAEMQSDPVTITPDDRAVAEPQAPEGSIASSIIEPAATLISGAVAEPIAGIAGIVSGAVGGDPVAAIESTREAFTLQPTTESGRRGMEVVQEFLAPVGEALQDAEKALGDSVFDATGSPTLAAAATTIPTAILELIGIGTAKGTIKSSQNLKKASQDRRVKKAIVQDAPSIEQLKEVSSGVYKELDESGVQISQEKVAKFANGLRNELKKEGLDPDLTPKANAAINRIIKDAEVGVETPLKEGLALSEIDTLRKVSQNAAGAIDPPDARLGSIIIENIDNFLDNVQADDLTRTGAKISEVGPKYKAARELWGRARRSELINESFEKAKNQASGFENGLVVQFRSILNNKKKSRFFKPDELKAMQEVVRGTTPTNIAKLVGRLGFTEGHATNLIGGSLGVAAGAQLGGPLGAVAVPLIGQVSRKLAQRMQRKGAEFADAVVRAGESGPEIVKAYLANTPKKFRKPGELSELLSRPNINLDDLLDSKSPVIKEAAEIARGRQILLGVQAIPGALEASQEDIAP